LSGLIVSENKTIEGINRLFVLEMKNQSTLNRFLTESKYDIACLKDHSTNQYVWAHNLVNLHYSDDSVDYPVGFELWRPMDTEDSSIRCKRME